MAMDSKYGYQIERTAISINAAGDSTLVAAVSGHRIRVVSLWLVSNGTTEVKFQSGASSDLSGPLWLENQSKFDLSEAEYGHFETVEGEALTINLTTKIRLGGSLTYFLT